LYTIRNTEGFKQNKVGAQLHEWKQLPIGHIGWNCKKAKLDLDGRCAMERNIAQMSIMRAHKATRI